MPRTAAAPSSCADRLSREPACSTSVRSTSNSSGVSGRNSPSRHAAPTDVVDDEVADPSGSTREPESPHDRLQVVDQLLDAERLGHVVVGSGRVASDAVLVARPGR